MSEVEKGQSITAFFTLKGDEEFLLDHFEGFPVMPGVLLLEALKQAACALLKSETGNGSVYRLAAVHGVKFGQFVKPGSRFEISVRLTRREGRRADFEGRARLVEGEMVGLPAGQAGARVLQAEFSLVPLSEG